jgi:hypothetical protein
MRSWIAKTALIVVFAAMAGSASAAPCKDAKGKFIACPKPVATAAATTTTRCKDAKGRFTKCPVTTPASTAVKRCRDKAGHFAKCGTPGAVPA